jgi:hypothetical protein
VGRAYYGGGLLGLVLIILLRFRPDAPAAVILAP